MVGWSELTPVWKVMFLLAIGVTIGAVMASLALGFSRWAAYAILSGSTLGVIVVLWNRDRP